MGAIARARRVAAFALAAVLLVGISGGALAQPEPNADPPPLQARFAPTGMVPELAIDRLHVEQAEAPAEPVVAVGFAGGFPLPPDGYRVSVLLGDPGAAQIRASLVVVGGSPTGALESGDGVTWDPLGATGVLFSEEGEVRVEVPAELAEGRTTVRAMAELPEGAGTASTPYFSWPDLSGEAAPGQLGVSTFGTVTDAALAPTGDVVALEGGPLLDVANGSAVVSFPQGPPVDLRGNPVAVVIDYLRVGVAGAASGLPPHYITIDHANRLVLLWDASAGLPALVPVDPAEWLVQGFAPPDPDSPVPDHAGEIVVDLVALSAAVGVPIEDPGFSLSLARSIGLVDGRLVSFDGVTGTLPWFEGSVAATVPPIEEDLAALAPEEEPVVVGEEGRGVPWWLIGLVAAVVVVGLGAWWFRRGRERDAPELEPGAPARDPALVGAPGDSARAGSAAEVSPDEALTALQRTVDEVAAKLDGPPSSKVQVGKPEPAKRLDREPPPSRDAAAPDERPPSEASPQQPPAGDPDRG